MGVADFVMARLVLPEPDTVTAALAVLLVRFGTTLVAVLVAVSLIVVPEAVLAFTCRTKLKLAGAFKARALASVQVMVPVPPTAGLVQVHPAGGVMDWKLVFGGVLCVKVAPVAWEGPRLVTLCV